MIYLSNNPVPIMIFSQIISEVDESAHGWGLETNTIPSRKRAHGRCTLHWANIGDGLIFEVLLSHLYAKERPGKLPTLSSYFE